MSSTEIHNEVIQQLLADITSLQNDLKKEISPVSPEIWKALSIVSIFISFFGGFISGLGTLDGNMKIIIGIITAIFAVLAPLFVKLNEDSSKKNTAVDFLLNQINSYFPLIRSKLATATVSHDNVQEYIINI